MYKLMRKSISGTIYVYLFNYLVILEVIFPSKCTCERIPDIPEADDTDGGVWGILVLHS